LSQVYHILDKIPSISKEEILLEYEELAQVLALSGKLCIDTDEACNFVRFIDPSINISLMISKEELEEPLLAILINKLKTLYRNTKQVDRKVDQALINLKSQCSKLQAVNPETKIKLARLFVQAAHPIVIRWLLRDQVQVFITYSHNIGDMMDMQDWQTSGSNSGMQSTDGTRGAIFVSCGGDPFAPNDEQGNGWSAVARLQIIAGQELGHFADIVRDSEGKQITRHSANFSGTKAKENVRIGRLADVVRCNELLVKLNEQGLVKLINCEQEIKFYKKNKITNLKTLLLRATHYILKHKLLSYAHNQKLHFIKRFAGDQYMGLMIKTMIEDMKFNLSPTADVYKRDDKLAEEAIACVEALARVPQQVNKWGYITTKAIMHNLYKIYFTQVIPSLIESYELVTGKKYIRNYAKPEKLWWKKIWKIK